MTPERTLPIVVVINRYLRHGGVEQQIRYLLESSGFQEVYRPVVIYFGQREPRAETWEGTTIFHCEWKFSTEAGWKKAITFVPFLWRVLLLVRKQSPALIHTYGPLENLIGALVSVVLRVAFVASIRTTIGWAYRLSSIWARRAKVVISNSQEGLDRLYARFASSREKGRLVRNGIDLSRFELHSASGQHRPVNAALIGRFSPSKQHLVLLRAVGDLYREGIISPESFRLRMVGPVENASYYEAVEREVRSAQLQEIVELKVGFFGADELYRDTDLVLLPSRTEGLPNVIIEAMACGIPWIATDVADVGYLAGRNQERGIIVPQGETAALTTALRTFIEADESTRRSRVKHAREFVESELTINRMVERTLEVYGEVLLND